MERVVVLTVGWLRIDQGIKLAMVETPNLPFVYVNDEMSAIIPVTDTRVQSLSAMQLQSHVRPSHELGLASPNYREIPRHGNAGNEK